MSRDNLLPFLPGETYFNGRNVSATAPSGQNLLGKEFRVEDTHTGGRKKLRVVQNVSGASITGANAGRGVRFTGVTGLNRKIAGYVASQGQYGLPVDDAYSGVTIAANDIFYICTEGFCKVKGSLGTTASTAITANAAFTWQAQGAIEPAAAGDFVVGRVVATLAASSTSGARVLAYIGDPGGNVN